MKSCCEVPSTLSGLRVQVCLHPLRTLHQQSSLYRIILCQIFGLYSSVCDCSTYLFCPFGVLLLEIACLYASRAAHRIHMALWPLAAPRAGSFFRRGRTVVWAIFGSYPRVKSCSIFVPDSILLAQCYENNEDNFCLCCIIARNENWRKRNSRLISHHQPMKRCMI